MDSRWMAVWVGGLVCVSPLAAEAHLRDYLVNTYYYTPKQGEIEVELHNDMHFTEAGNDETYSSEHQLEVEYGLTNHLQLAYYEVHTWDRERNWKRDALKIEGKLRFAEAGQWPVDIALYTEYENPDGPYRAHSDTLETKVIVSRDVELWNLIGNVIVEKQLNGHAVWEFAYTAGASYAVTPRVRLGLELKETLGDSDRFWIHRGTSQLYLVPGVYASLTPHVRILAGPAFGLTRVSDDLQLKSIVEVEF